MTDVYNDTNIGTQWLLIWDKETRKYIGGDYNTVKMVLLTGYSDYSVDHACVQVNPKSDDSVDTE